MEAPEVLVSADWLKSNLSNPAVRVVEVDVSPAAYDEWHIDGAVLWNIYSDLKDAQYHPVGPAALQRLVTNSGIDGDSTVVFYGYAPALGFWLLHVFGHPNVRILDCSRQAWRHTGYPCSTAATTPPPGTLRLAEPDLSVWADEAAVLQAIGKQGTTLVDVRSLEEYRGERFWPSGAMDPDGRAGHVPSAVHQPITDLYEEDGSFRSPVELREKFRPDVLDRDDDLVTYCTVGGRAATAWFVLTHLIGRDRVRVYDGSWAEWGRTPGAPVEPEHVSA